MSLLHLLQAKEENNAPLIVCDPRFTRTAAHADEYVRFRSGTDVALIWGMLWHIFENGWEDKEFIRKRVWGMDQVREPRSRSGRPRRSSASPACPASSCSASPRRSPSNRPGTLIWCMGGTQHTIGNNNVRAYCILQLALGNIGIAGGGANIFRGHDNVQGATDIGVEPDTLPGYYGLTEGAWQHWAASGTSTTSGMRRALPDKDADGEGGHTGLALARRRARGQGEHRPARRPPGDGLLGPCAQLADARAGPEEGHGEARPARRHRSAIRR